MIALSHNPETKLARETGVSLRHLVLSLAVVLSVASIAGADSSLSKSMTVSTTVLASLRYTFDAPSSLTITSEDVVRGFVDVPAGALLKVQTNNPDGYVLHVVPQGDDVTAIQVSGLDSTLNATGAGASRWFPVQGVLRSSMKLGFRLTLSKTATAGERPWPVQVSVMF